jgi:acyl dehydratase
MLPEEITSYIGRAGEVKILEVEKGAIRKYADAVDDRKPLYWDEEYARNSRYHSMIAPPGFFGWPTSWSRGGMLTFGAMREVSAALNEAGFRRVLDGAIEFDFYRPVRAGDTLAALSVIKDIKEREGRSGKMVFVITETTFTNQKGDVVARMRRTLIH